METPNTKTETLPPPPGIIGSLKAGFDTIAAHITAILLPLALDLLLWLGPRLSMERLFQPILRDFGKIAAGGGFSAADLQKALDMYDSLFHEFNLFSVLRTFPIGISSLMSAKFPLTSPLGAPTIMQVDSPETLLGWIALLTVLGWIGGGLYFRWIAVLVVNGAPDLAGRTGHALLQTILYSLLWSVLALTLGLPIVFVIYFLFLLSPLIAQGVILLLGFLSMWLIVPAFFSPHGIFVGKQNAFASILSGLQMARFTLPTSSLFVLTVFLLSVGLNFLWAVPSDDSWMALVGILGHAFITTALLAASFIYYRDMNAWLQTVLERLRANAATPQV